MTAAVDDERRPAGGAESSSKNSTVNGMPDQRQEFVRHGAALRQVPGTLVVVVETPGGKYRRRCYLSLASAERAVKRAEAAGYTASVVLARLEPVAGWGA